MGEVYRDINGHHYRCKSCHMVVELGRSHSCTGPQVIVTPAPAKTDPAADGGGFPYASPKGALYRRRDPVYKNTGDYTFIGWVVCVYEKLDDVTVRYIVEDERGLELIMNEKQMKRGRPEGWVNPGDTVEMCELREKAGQYDQLCK